MIANCIKDFTLRVGRRPFVVEAEERNGAWIIPDDWGPYSYSCGGSSNAPGKTVSLKCFSENPFDPYICPAHNLKTAMVWDSFLVPKGSGRFGVGSRDLDSNWEINESFCLLGSRGVVELIPDDAENPTAYTLEFFVETMARYADDLYFYHSAIILDSFAVWTGVNRTGTIAGEYISNGGGLWRTYPKFTIEMR